jgi:Fis family transcriptional regulator
MNELEKNEFAVEAASHSPREVLRINVKDYVNRYFQHPESIPIPSVYPMILADIEPPMLKAVLEHCRHNQTKAANILGLNRGTLRKKLKLYGML